MVLAEGMVRAVLIQTRWMRKVVDVVIAVERGSHLSYSLPVEVVVHEKGL